MYTRTLGVYCYCPNAGCLLELLLILKIGLLLFITIVGTIITLCTKEKYRIISYYELNAHAVFSIPTSNPPGLSRIPPSPSSFNLYCRSFHPLLTSPSPEPGYTAIVSYMD